MSVDLGEALQQTKGRHRPFPVVVLLVEGVDDVDHHSRGWGLLVVCNVGDVHPGLVLLSLGFL